MKNLCIITSAVVLSKWPQIVEAAVSIPLKRCGTKTCEINEFCSKLTNQCDNCYPVCDESSHNYDHELCTNECIDYLRDMRYVKVSNYTADTKIIQNQQTIMLIILIIMFVLFILVHGTHFMRWLRKRDFDFSFKCLKKMNKKTMPPPQITATSLGGGVVANPNTQSPKMHRPRLDTNGRVFSVSGVDGSTIQTVSTPISNRHPAEDSTLEYSYDNGGLVTTPVSEKTRGTETTF